MSTTSTRLGMILPDDGGPNGDDIVNVTTQISNNFQTLENSLAFLHIANQAALPSSGNFKGRLCWADDTGTVWRYDGSGWVVAFDTQWQSWTPPNAPITPAGNITLGNSVVTASYKREYSDVHYKYRFEMGNSGFGGGSGDWSFPIPFPCLEISVSGSGWLYLHGYAYYNCVPKVGIGSGNQLALFCPANNSAGNSWPIKNETWNGSSGGGVGTGTPTVPGAFTMTSTAPDTEFFFETIYKYI